MDWKELVGHRDGDTLLASALERLRQSGSGITNLNAGGVMRTLTELAVQGVADLYDLLAGVVPQGFASHATGQWLDLKCGELGFGRHQAQKTAGMVVFGRTTTGASVVIPRGSIVQTVAFAGDTLRYTVTSDAAIGPDELECSVPVIAEFAGAQHNVGPGAIGVLTTYILGVDFVRNDAGWILSEGADEEDDESLRARYYLRWQELSQSGTKGAYVSWAKQVTGVTDVAVDDDAPRGQGTVDVVVLGTAGLPTEALLAEVAEHIEARRPLCANVLVKAPAQVDVDACVHITPHPVYGDAAAIHAAAESRIRALIGLTPAAGIPNLAIGESLYKARLVATCMAIPNVLSVTIASPTEDVIAHVDEWITLRSLEVIVT